MRSQRIHRCRYYLFALGIVFVFSLMIVPQLFSAQGSSKVVTEGEWGFDRNLEYDILFTDAYNATTTIEDVQILGFQDLGGKTFLVVQSKGFRLQDARGFILFDAITAILPSQNFIINSSSSQRIPVKK